MADTYDLVIAGGTVVNHDGIREASIGVRDGKIAHIGSIAAETAGQTINAKGLHILPGVIDSQVHFREPGGEHKETLGTGSQSAVMGGVTTVFEMPNTNPLTTSPETLADKVKRGRETMFCDFAFYVGATRENIADIPELERLPGSAGIKVFIGSSTGNLLVDDRESLSRVIAALSRRAAFHSEDEERLNARKDVRREGDPSSHTEWRDPEAALISTRTLLELAHEHGKRVHVLHISTGEEMQLLAGHKDVASVEATPQHLTLTTPQAYERLGARAQMNPPLRDASHQEILWWGVEQGVVDVLGSDHAPHTLEEKAMPYPQSPSGMPGVQTLVPVMLTHVNSGRLSLERFVDLTSHGPQRIFGLAGKGRIAVGYDADFTVVDLKQTRTIESEWIACKSGWTPFEGHTVTGWPRGTIIRGRRVMWEDEIVGKPGGEPARFWEALSA